MFGFSKDVSLSNPFSRASGSRSDKGVAAAADKKGKYDKKDAPLGLPTSS